MSNPGVMLLAERDINGQSLRIEDNVGEAIHIHYGSMRIDMTINEFLDLEEQWVQLINRMIAVEGFNIRDFDPIYLYLGLSGFVCLERISIDYVELGRLVTETKDLDENERFISVTDSRITQALRGDDTELLKRQQINLYGEDNRSRFEKVLKSINDNSYPYNNEHIILYNEGLYIRDGLHRASCLFHLRGNVKIPVLRLYFYNNAYSDEYKEEEFKERKRWAEEEERLLEEQRKFLKEQQIHQYEQVKYENVVKSLYKALMNELLIGKKVAIKGAGRHTEEVLKLLDKNIDLRCIIAREKKFSGSYGIEIIKDADIKDYDIDTILISAIMHRDVMIRDILEATYGLEKDYYVLDIYTVMWNLGIKVTRGIV